MLNFLSRTLTLTLTLKQHSFKNQTNPNPVNMFYWHPFEFVHFFMHTYPTPLPIPTLPCFWAFALWCIWKCLLFCASYHDVSCNKYLPFQLCSSLKVLSPWRGDILFFICAQPPPPSLPPSLPQGEFLKSCAKILLGPFGQSPTPAPRFSDTHLK